MFSKIPILFLILFSATSTITPQSIKINGRLYDKNEGKIIADGVILLNPGNHSTTTNLYGEYSFTTSPGAKQITTRVLGYNPTTIRFELTCDTTINIYIKVSPIELREVTITSDSIKSVEITSRGSYIITPAAIRETPKLFSEPDLLKSFQLMPGVVSGKEGSTDIYVRGGGMGQNIILANGCYFFLPGHLLGIVSPFDLDFIESAELYKDYFPSDLGGGTASVISLEFKEPQTDSLSAQLRLGLLSSGLTIEIPVKKLNLEITAGLKRGNYSVYAPLLKKIVSSEVGDYLPPNNYSFYDGFLQISHSSAKWGKIRYLFFGNYDNGKNENITNSCNGDTVIQYTDGISTGWNNMVHALQWDLPVKNNLKSEFSLNYNRLSMGRDIYMNTEKSLNNNGLIETRKTSFSFSPIINNIGATFKIEKNDQKFSYSAGISGRLKFLDPGINATAVHNDTTILNNFGEAIRIFEPAAFISSTILLNENFQIDAGLRLSIGITQSSGYVVPEPRIRLTYNHGGIVSSHINYVRLSQFDHSVEGSNIGLRTVLWIPASKEFGPEISDVLSAGFQGQIKNDFIWSLDIYYKRISGMVDYKPGASFIFDSTFVDLLDRIDGTAYGFESGIVKRTGNFTGSVSYTYSRSIREWIAPEGLIWIPSGADRPHNFNLTLKYYFKNRTSFGLNWVYQSGAPATIYMHETSYGEFFETKNNIRYFNYHRLDLSLRQLIYKRKFSIFIDADVYNVYNRKNTFYFKEIYDETEKRYYYKNISLFPIMPSLTVTIKY